MERNGSIDWLNQYMMMMMAGDIMILHKASDTTVMMTKQDGDD